MSTSKMFTSSISGITFPEKEMVPGNTIRIPILDLIQKDHPDFKTTDCIANAELNVYREKYISKYLNTEIHQLTALQKNVIDFQA